MSDPFITKNAQKKYRVDGNVLGLTDEEQPFLKTEDPRSPITRIAPKSSQSMELTVPRYAWSLQNGFMISFIIRL